MIPTLALYASSTLLESDGSSEIMAVKKTLNITHLHFRAGYNGDPWRLGAMVHNPLEYLKWSGGGEWAVLGARGLLRVQWTDDSSYVHGHLRMG